MDVFYIGQILVKMIEWLDSHSGVDEWKHIVALKYHTCSGLRRTPRGLIRVHTTQIFSA